MNCPIGVYFDLEHNGNKVKVSNIKKQFGVGEADSKLYSGIEVVLDKTSYAKEVIKFAGQVKSFFGLEPERNLQDEFDRKQWDAFWNEFDTLYANAILKYK